MENMEVITIVINGKTRRFIVGDEEGCVRPEETLLQTLRNRLKLTAAKEGCNHGACGNCTVIVDGDAVPSCMILTADLNGSEVLTLEGLEDPDTGEVSLLQQCFIDNTAFQCGFCTPGIIMSTHALLCKNPDPTVEEIREALSGNFCRCISQYQVLTAVQDCIQRMKRIRVEEAAETAAEAAACPA